MNIRHSFITKKSTKMDVASRIIMLVIVINIELELNRMKIKNLLYGVAIMLDLVINMKLKRMNMR